MDSRTHRLFLVLCSRYPCEISQTKDGITSSLNTKIKTNFPVCLSQFVSF